MAYLLVTLLGVLAGGICVFLVLEAKRRRLEHQKREQDAQAKVIQNSREEIERTRAQYAEFEARFISYKELQDENSILKHDLQNVDVNLRKLQLDRDLQRQYP